MGRRAKSPGPDAGQVGAKIRALRERAGLSRERLAEVSGISTSAISALELAYVEDPDLRTLRELARGLGVAPAELLTPVGEQPLAEWLTDFERSPHAAILSPPLSDSERAWLLGFPAATWTHLPPSPATLRALIEDRRRRGE